MSDPDDLLQKLASLARTDDTFIAGARVISQGGAPSPLQALLKEIDETVLACELTFQFGEAGTLGLSVSGRRLLEVNAMEGIAMPSVAEQIVGKAVSDGDETALRALIGVLMQLDLLKDPITVRSKPSDSFGSQSDAGLSPSALAEHLSVTYPFVPPSRLKMFLGLISAPATATVYIDQSGAETRSGPDLETSRLKNALDSWLSHKDSSKQSQILTSFGQGSATEALLSIARDGEELLVWAQNIDDISASYQAWHKIYVE